MDKKTCESCDQDAKIMCFCRKALLCERCVGKHLMDEPSLSHKPCTLTSENMKMYEEHMHTLQANEEQLLGEARRRQELTQAYRSKLMEGLERLRSLQPLIVDYVSLAAEVASKQIPEIAEKLGQEMIAACQENADVLQEAVKHFKGSELHPDNELVKVLEAAQTPAEVAGLELVTCKLDLGEINVEPMLRKGIHFAVALMRVPPKTSGKSSPPPKSNLPKPGKISKKPSSKSDNRSGSASTKGLHSQSASTVDTKSIDRSFDSGLVAVRGSKGGKKALSPPAAQKIPHVQAQALKQASSETHLPTVPVPSAHPELVKADSPSPEPLQSPAAQPFRKFPTEVPETSLERSRLARLHLARSQNRQDLLKETEQKVLNIEEQVRGLKITRPMDRDHPGDVSAGEPPETQNTLSVRPADFPRRDTSPRG